MFQISTALSALNSTLLNQKLSPVLAALNIHINNKVSLNTKESILFEIENSKPNFLFISSNLPGVIKLEEVITRTKQISPKTKIFLVLTENDLSKALNYLLTNVDSIIYSENLLDSFEFAIKQVFKGQTFLCGTTTQSIKNSMNNEKLESKTGHGLLSLLTDREAEILHSLTQGINYKQISKLLFISESTVKTHINNIFTKLNVNDRTQAVLYALKHGIESVVKNPNILNKVTLSNSLSEI